MTKSIVSIAKGTDVEKMVAEVLEPLGGVKGLIRPKSTVVLKPNAGHVAPAESSVAVHRSIFLGSFSPISVILYAPVEFEFLTPLSHITI